MRELTERQRRYKAHLEAAASEGISVSEYARRHGLDAQALYSARRELAAKSRFVRVAVRREPASHAVRVELPNGVSVSIPASCAADLAGLLRAAAAL
ncbi:MAG: hypothetical protein V2J02_21605 [Pseudomonadales bacterium]|jgi:transposase-like protein|nr:hypothetical protein [Pseudomonadales bacterium]